jgi:DNA-binding beta-propeller fold protein YncE
MRRALTLAALAATVVVGMLPAASAHGAGYTFPRQFAVPEGGNEQGLAYGGGRFYVAFDLEGAGSARIVAYDTSGHEVRRSGRLPLGHAAELSYRQASGNLYVADGTPGRPCRVTVVDLRASPARIARTYDFSALGAGGMVAIDNTRDRMIVSAGPAGRPFTIAFVGMDGRVQRRFTSRIGGVRQGLEVVGDRIALYTSAPDNSSNTLTVLSDTGKVLRTIRVPVAREGEGLAVNSQTRQLYVGFGHPNAVHRMSPALLPSDRDAQFRSTTPRS